MTVSRIPATAPKAAAPRRPLPAAVAPTAKGTAADSLALSGSSQDAKALALLKEAIRLDALGYYTPAEEKLEKALDEAETLDVMLAVRDLYNKTDDEGKYYRYDSFYRERAEDRANELAKKISVSGAPGTALANAYLAQAEKLHAQGLKAAAQHFYDEAVEEAPSLKQVLAIAAALVKHANPWDTLDYDQTPADERAADLIRDLPEEKGDAAAVEALALAKTMMAAKLERAAEVHLQRAIKAAETAEPLYAVQKLAEEHELSGIQRNGYPPDIVTEVRDRIWRLENPFKWSSPSTWMNF